MPKPSLRLATLSASGLPYHGSGFPSSLQLGLAQSAATVDDDTIADYSLIQFHTPFSAFTLIKFLFLGALQCVFFLDTADNLHSFTRFAIFFPVSRITSYSLLELSCWNSSHIAEVTLLKKNDTEHPVHYSAQRALGEWADTWVICAGLMVIESLSMTTPG